MKRDETKAILELYRPDHPEDQADPLIAQALQLLESDPELRAWFDAQQAIDARIEASYQELEVPDDLKAGILAGMRAHALRSESGSERESASFAQRSDTRSQAWWRHPLVGMAAVFAVLLAIVVLPNKRGGEFGGASPAQVQAGVPDMIQFLATQINDLGSRGGFDKTSSEPAALKSYLASVGASSPSKLPRSLENNPSLGCFTFNYNNIKMGMICFKDKQVVHLITVQKSDCPKSFQPEEPTFYEVDNQAFRAWTDEDQVYIISTQGGKEMLPEWI